MSAEFNLHPKLLADTYPLGTLTLCEALLMNDSRFPWIILVPRVAGIREWFELEGNQQCQLHEEVMQVAQQLQNLTQAYKINIAALGNMVPQLHVHIIARFETDAAWPNPVWGFAHSTPYTTDTLAKARNTLVLALKN